MNVIDKYLTESSLKTDRMSLKDLIQSNKSGNYNVEGNNVRVTRLDDTIIFSYPSDMLDFTYKLAQVSDALKLDYNQIGLGKKKMVKFIIDLG